MTICRIFILIAFVCETSCSLQAGQQFSSDLVAEVKPAASIQRNDFNKTVVPISELKFMRGGIEGEFGTGFCLDPICRFIGTNYHVAMISRPDRIKRQAVTQRYLATGPEDEGATLNDGPSVGPMRFNLSRDLAILELRHPLNNYHGVAFSLDELQIGQEVDIYAYPKKILNPLRSLMEFHGTFKGETTAGLLAFDYTLTDGAAIRPGASGGIVVDRKTQQIVGVLSAIATNTEGIALAVPIPSLAEFVGKVQPFLATSLFPRSKQISPLSRDLYEKFVATPAGAFERRPEESGEVKLLRGKAQALADSMRNFIAVQTFAWGSEGRPPSAESAYEVRVLDGYQRFREYPDGKKELRDVPFPPLNMAMVPGGEWSELPEMVGTELRLMIQQAADVNLNGQEIKVFQYRADAEDGVCRWKSVVDLGLFAISKTSGVACYGEVWTDRDSNILRMSEHYELPGKWKDYQALVTYGWLEKANEPPRLIPLTIASQAEYNRKLYWCRGQFTGYQVFGSEVKIAAN